LARRRATSSSEIGLDTVPALGREPTYEKPGAVSRCSRVYLAHKKPIAEANPGISAQFLSFYFPMRGGTIRVNLYFREIGRFALGVVSG
jgi:hypothetical protein